MHVVGQGTDHLLVFSEEKAVVGIEDRAGLVWTAHLVDVQAKRVQDWTCLIEVAILADLD